MATKLHGPGGETGDALRRIQTFDAQSLVRENELGSKFAMREAVAPTKRVIDLFRMIAPEQVDFFANDQKRIILDSANAFYNLLDEVQKFDVEEASPNPTAAKTNLLQRLEGQFQPTFNQLYPLVSFASTRTLDFSALEREARAAVQAAKDSSSAVLTELNAQKQAVDTIVSEVRALAAEQGVSKQAIHFKNEADRHADSAIEWRRNTLIASGGLAIFAFLALFIHKIPLLAPTSGYDATQLIVSKLMVFGVIAYLVILSARNFLASRHNEIVNRHRQNALATFTALAEATSDAASSDIVLSHAAACIFSPQETGFSKHDSASTDSVPALQIIPRIGQVTGTGH